MRKPPRLFPSVVLAFFLAVGFAAVWGILVSWAHATVRSFQPPELEERVLFLADGTAVVERLSYVNGEPVVPPDGKFRTLNGDPVTIGEGARWAGGVPLYGRGTGESLLGGFLSPEATWEWRLRRVGDMRDPVAWYFLCDGRRHGQGYFAAYDTRRAEWVGHLGTAGFRDGPLPPEELFPFDGSDRGIDLHLLRARTHFWRFHPLTLPSAPLPPEPGSIYLQGDNDTIYQVDLRTRRVGIAFEGRPVRAAALLARSAPPPLVGRTSLVVRTDDAVLQLDAENKVVRRFPVPEDQRERGFLWTVTDSGEIVTLSDEEYDFPLSRVLDQVSWYDADGHLLRREQTWTRKRTQNDQRVFAAAVLSPLVADWIFADPLMLVYFERWSDYGKFVKTRLAGYWPTLLFVHAAAAGLAWLCRRRLARYGAGRAERVVWPVFVFLLGLPGWVGFRFARSWPVLERCPSCGAAVPRDRVPCAACGADFPPPALKGTEVLA